MRQTSRAVALLLAVESANAAVTLNFPAPTAGQAYNVNVFNPAATVDVANSNQLNSRTAGYANRHPAFNPQPGAAWGALVTNKAFMVTTAYDAATAQTVAGSGCMLCLNAAGVWCSSTYSYLSTTTAFQQETTTAAGNSLVFPASEPLSIGGAALDNGSCCETDADFNTFVYTQVQRTTLGTHLDHNNGTSVATAGVAMVSPACVAIKNTVTGGGSAGTAAFSTSEIDDTAAAYRGWWCSNGLYKMVKTGNVLILNAQQVIPNGVNKRKELAQVGCPQAKAACGDGATVAIELTAVVTTRAVEMPTAGITTLNKCTWVTYSKIAAPAFSFAENTALDGITGTNW